MRRLGIAILTATLLLALPAPAHAEIEGYASYDPSTKCHPKPFAGTRQLGAWVARTNGGGYVGMGRSCSRKEGPTSDHQTGRAFDWSVDATRAKDRKRVQGLLRKLFQPDRFGNKDALARRMGITYIIWNDEMYPAWNEFRAEPYLSSSCHKRKKCSKTLRHRDHVHVSLSKAGAHARTSWFERRAR